WRRWKIERRQRAFYAFVGPCRGPSLVAQKSPRISFPAGKNARKGRSCLEIRPGGSLVRERV
ncbi:MAG: hypothetical protein ACK52A_18395, partial [Planctomycetota bacterium]